MYLAEGRFYYERMGEFINVAEDLEVNEIRKGVEIPNKMQNVTEETVIDEEEEGFTEQSVEKLEPIQRIR